MFEAPYPPYDPSDKTWCAQKVTWFEKLPSIDINCHDVYSFSYATVSERWPSILEAVIDHLNEVIDELSTRDHDTPDSANIRFKLQEGIDILEQIKRLKERMSENLEMELIAHDGGAHINEYNVEITRLAQLSKNTWLTAPWLFAECYLYRLLRTYFGLSQYWCSYDPFFTQKIETLRKCRSHIYDIAVVVRNLEHSKADLEGDPAKVQQVFEDMVDMCLWGNRVDLSLFVHFLSSNSQHSQPVLRGPNGDFMLTADQKSVWQHLKRLRHARIDTVLDNAGFELFTDLVFADFLVTFTPHVSNVVFHPKLIPWFVSDVTPFDFKTTIAALLDPAIFPPPLPSSPDYAAWQALVVMVTRWETYLEEKVFILSVPEDTPLGGSANEQCEMASYWTSPWPFWDMQIQANGLWNWLKGSGLVIFKGDLNYRKLTGDIRWPVTTPFPSALGPLAGSFPIVSMCTSKSDVVVGMKADTAEDLDNRDDKWRVNGTFAFVSFVPSSEEQ